ncbi:MAG: hypothetical protein P4L57_04550 [Rhizomicrobium sp.]|nr:hypothetical protein [Rhizomicrobium sp.]
MSEWREVRLNRINGAQVINIPPEFELPGEYAMMRKEGDRLIIEPMPNENSRIDGSRRDTP